MWFKHLMLVFILPCLILSCSDQGDYSDNRKQLEGATEAEGDRGGIYRIPLQNSPATLDPGYVQDSYGTYVVHQIFDGLVRFDRHLMVVPALATSWRAEDGGRTYRFFLNAHASFHDSSPVSGKDVIYSLQRLLRVSPPSVLLPHLLKIEGAEAYRDGQVQNVSGLVAEDDHTVVIRLTEPHTPFLTALSMNQAKIVPQRIVEERGDEYFGSHPVGSGPFAFEAWTAEGEIKLKRYDAYHDTPARLDEVVFKIYPGAEIDRILEDFRAGKLEEMPVYGSIGDRLEEVDGLQLLHRPSLSLLYYGIRMDRPPLNHPDLRKALSLAIDREKLVKDVYDGLFDPSWVIFPPGMPGYTPARPLQSDRLELARRLIDRVEQETGALPPLEVVSASKSAFAESELDFMRRAWAAIGVRLEPKFITDWNEFEAYLHSDDLQLFRYVWVADMPDPDNFMSPLFESGAPANFMHCSSSELDEQLSRARSLTDPVERDALYERIEAMVLDMQPIIPLFNLSTDRAYQASVRGVYLTPLGWQDLRLNHVWIQ